MTPDEFKEFVGKHIGTKFMYEPIKSTVDVDTLMAMEYINKNWWIKLRKAHSDAKHDRDKLVFILSDFGPHLIRGDSAPSLFECAKTTLQPTIRLLELR